MTSWLKPLTAAALTAVGLTVFTGSALAQTPAHLAHKQEQRVDNRQERQSDRITQGVESGQLTVREQAHLEKQQRHINRLERRTEADGKVTAKEAVRIEKAQDRASRQIRHNKHDRQQARW